MEEETATDWSIGNLLQVFGFFYEVKDPFNRLSAPNRNFVFSESKNPRNAPFDTERIWD